MKGTVEMWVYCLHKLQRLDIPNLLGVHLLLGGKKNISNEVLKSEFLKHAGEHQGQSVFTDGPKSSEGVGCAVVTGDTVIRRKLHSSCSIFTAEAFAILLFVKHVFNKGNF